MKYDLPAIKQWLAARDQRQAYLIFALGLATIYKRTTYNNTIYSI